MNNQEQQCMIIDDEYKISKSLCKFINNISSIDKQYILSYIINEQSLKKRAFEAWKNR